MTQCPHCSKAGLELPHHYFSDSNMPTIQELWLVVIYYSHRLKCIVLLSFNDTIKYFRKNMSLRLSNYVESLRATLLSKRSLFKLPLQFTTRDIMKGNTELLLIDSFLEERFLPKAQIKFYGLKFLWFQGCSSTCIFCLSWAPVLSSYIYTVNESPLKYLDTSFFHTLSSPLCVFGYDSRFVYKS